MQSGSCSRADLELAELQEHYEALSELATRGCHEAVRLCIALTEPDPMRDAWITLEHIRKTVVRLRATFAPPAPAPPPAVEVPVPETAPKQVILLDTVIVDVVQVPELDAVKQGAAVEPPLPEAEIPVVYRPAA